MSDSIKQDSDQSSNEDMFGKLIGQDIFEFIAETAPRKVMSRVGKALDHYSKAVRLNGIDDEMGAIRLIAAEEELVVALFEWVKINSDKIPEHRDFISKFKNHLVKLAFYPVLSQFRFVLDDMLKQGFTMDGLEDVLTWTARPVLHEGKVMLSIRDRKDAEIIKANPLDIAISWEGTNGRDVIDELYEDFAKLVADQQKMNVKEFVVQRADFRNKLLYAEDGGFWAMGDSFDDLLATFERTYHDLLWALAVLLGNEPLKKSWGLVNQFIALYRRVLVESKLIKPVGSDEPIEAKNSASASAST